MKTVLFVFLILFVSGCSTKSPPNRWQYQTNASYKSFERYYLENNTDMAAIEFSRARSYATQSADLSTLARIELSRCGLKFAMLEPFSCKEYENLIHLTQDSELQAYYELLDGKISQESIATLPTQYQAFVSSMHRNNEIEMNREINKITPLTSRMIAAAMVIEHLDDPTIEGIIADASYLGYKHAVIVWMNVLIQRTSDQNKRKILREKVNILIK